MCESEKVRWGEKGKGSVNIHNVCEHVIVLSYECYDARGCVQSMRVCARVWEGVLCVHKGM